MTPRQRLTTLMFALAVPLAATACRTTVDSTTDPTTISAARESTTTDVPASQTDSRPEDVGSTSTTGSTTVVNTEPGAAADGLPDPSGATGWLCVIPPGPEWPRLFPDTSWCPTDLATRSRQFSFRATFTDGSEVSGVTPWITPGTHWSVSPGPGDGTIRIDVHSDGAISTGWGWG